MPAAEAVVHELETPQGLARAHVHAAEDPVAVLVLGHGAGGSVNAPDLKAVTAAALGAGLAVALVEQPYRVAGRRSPPPAPRLDEAWTAVVEQLRSDGLIDAPLLLGGRSSGARVACRTAAELEARAVICVAFPLHPPRRSATAPVNTRLDELDAAGVPTLVVQGARDPFGMPPPGPDRTVVTVPGTHTLSGSGTAIAAAVRDWLPGVLSPRAA
jgi:predicted alpha/beta-hydrolase family hydrolase